MKKFKKMVSLVLLFALVMSIAVTTVVNADVGRYYLPLSPLNAVNSPTTNEWTMDFSGEVTFGSRSDNANEFMQDVANAAGVIPMIIPEPGLETNKVLQIPVKATDGSLRELIGQARRIDKAITEKFGKASIDFKMSKTTEQTTLELFSYINGNYGLTGGESGIVIKNGGIQAKDYDKDPTGLTQFVQNGTLVGGKWYSLERYFDFRIDGQNYSRFTIKERDNQDGYYYDSGWCYMGKQTGMLTIRFKTTGYDATDCVYLDNLQNVKFTNLPKVSYIQDNNAAENGYIHMDKNGVIGVLYANEIESGAFKAVTASNYHRWEEKLLFTNFGANFEADIFPYSQSNSLSTFSTPIKVKDNKVYYNSYDSNTGAWTLNEITNFTLDRNTWYNFKLEYTGTGGIKKVADCADPSKETAIADIFISDANGNELASAKNVTIKAVLYGTATTPKASLGFVSGNFVERPVYVDDIKVAFWHDSFDGETANFKGLVYIDADIEGYLPGTSVDAVIKAECIADHGADRYSGIYNTLNTTVGVNKRTILDGKISSINVPSIRFMFTQPMATSTFTEENVTVSAYGQDLGLDKYEIEALSDTEFKINFIAPLDYETVYTLTLSNKIIDKVKYGVSANNVMPQEYYFVTGSEEEHTLTVASVELQNENGVEYTKNTLASGDKVKAAVNLKNEAIEKSYTIILCIYKDKQLKDIIFKSGIMASNSDINPETELLTNIDDGSTAKVFVWNSFETMTALCGETILGQ